MTEQPNLFGDDVWSMLEQLIAGIGGMKRVGYELRPDKSPDAAAQWLRDAINPKRREILYVDDFLHILRRAHEKGIHAGMDFMCDDLDYERTRPVNKANRIAERQKEFIRHVERLNELASMLKADGVQLREVK